MNVVCPKCKSADVRQDDRATICYEVLTWTRDEFGVIRPDEYGDRNVDDEMDEPAVPGKPFLCCDCGEHHAAEDLIEAPEEPDGDEPEDDS